MMYRITYSNQSCSEYLKDLLAKLRVKTKNLREMYKLQVPNPNITGFGSISVKYSVAVIWNNISVVLRS